jgi:hypothetical protein
MVLVNFVGAFTAINQNVEMPELTLEPDSTGGENQKNITNFEQLLIG